LVCEIFALNSSKNLEFDAILTSLGIRILFVAS
jgi:hypothetical protein